MNYTFDTGFILDGFKDLSHVYILIFLGFLFIYITTFMGNLSTFVLITTDSDLQSPMYFFLQNLSFVDVCYSSVILPKILRDISVKNEYISFIGCVVQMFCFCLFGTTECFLLGIMAYDRYAAICHPLHYTVLLTWYTCIKFIILCWTASFVLSVIPTGWIFSLSFCGSRTIQHYFCELLPLLELSCSNTMWIIIALIVYDTIAAFVPFILILLSYIKIITTILNLRIDERQKAFSTCSSHLLCVALFYSSGMVSYMIPKSLLPTKVQRANSLFYTIFLPMLNPFIYSMRNAEVKQAFLRLLYGKRFR